MKKPGPAKDTGQRFEDNRVDLVLDAIRNVGEQAAAQMAEQPNKDTPSPSSVPVFASLISRAFLAVLYSEEFFDRGFNKEVSQEPRRASIDELLEELRSPDIIPRPRKQSVYGVFFGCHLLFRGWWDRPPEANVVVGTEKHWGSHPEVAAVQQWLNYGYEQWGPSWDLWDPEADTATQCLFGQIGRENSDEADSLHVIVAPKAAARLRREMKEEGRLAARVVAEGTLFHDQHRSEEGMPDHVIKAIRAKDPSGLSRESYYLVINDVEPGGKTSYDYIDLDVPKPVMYSAYLWICLIKESDRSIGESGEITSDKVIFLWSHTNVLSKACVRFDYYTLVKQKQYLEDELREKLIVLQQSYFLKDMIGEDFDKPLVKPEALSKMLRATRTAFYSNRRRGRPARRSLK